MYVSYSELYTHCKKIFKAHGIPDGCAEDGAEAIAWGEFCGLNTYDILVSEIENKEIKDNQEIDVVAAKENHYCLDVDGQSHLVLGRLLADYAFVKSKDKEKCIFHVTNISTSNSLAYQAYQLARKGKATLINYSNIDNVQTWILATPSKEYPLIISDNNLDELKRDKIAKYIDKQHLTARDQNEFVMFVFNNDFVEQLMTACNKADKNLVEVIISSDFMKSAFEYAHKHGLFIRPELWEQLNEIGAKTLVESSETSRIRGAGEQA